MLESREFLVDFHQVLSPVDKSGAWCVPLKQKMLYFYILPAEGAEILVFSMKSLNNL